MPDNDVERAERILREGFREIAQGLPERLLREGLREIAETLHRTTQHQEIGQR